MLEVGEDKKNKKKSTSLPEGQGWLVLYFKTLGYQPLKLCFGLANMMALTVFTGEEGIQNFNERLEQIYNVPIEKFPKFIQEAKLGPESRLLGDKKHSEERSLEINIFFQAVMLFQESYKYPDVLGKSVKTQNINEVMPLLMPVVLSPTSDEKKLKKHPDSIGSSPLKIGPGFSILSDNENELAEWMAKVPTAMKAISASLSFVLLSSNHAMNVSFVHNPKTGGSWLWLDAEALPARYISSNKEIAKKIGLFSSNNVASFYIAPVYLHKNSKQIENFLNDWRTIAPGYKQKLFGSEMPSKTKKVDSYRASWLSIAARHGELALATKLVKAGASVNLQDNEGATPLYLAAEKGHLEMVKFLLKAGANPNIMKTDGRTPLYIAMHQEEEAIINCLIKANAEIDEITQNLALLHVAVRRNSEKIVDKLLALGVKPDVSTEEGLTPLHLAVKLKNEKIVASLLAFGADPDAEYGNEITPLEIAACAGNTRIVQMLLQAEADPNKVIIKAAMNKNKAVIIMLLQQGVLIQKAVKEALEMGMPAIARDLTELAEKINSEIKLPAERPNTSTSTFSETPWKFKVNSQPKPSQAVISFLNKTKPASPPVVLVSDSQITVSIPPSLIT